MTYPFMFHLYADDCKTLVEEFEVEIEAHAEARYGIDPSLEIDAVWMGYEDKVNVLRQSAPLLKDLALAIVDQAEDDEVLQEQVFISEGFYKSWNTYGDLIWKQGVAA